MVSPRVRRFSAPFSQDARTPTTDGSRFHLAISFEAHGNRLTRATGLLSVIDRIEGHDWGVRSRQPAAGGRKGDASFDGAVDVPRGADQIPEAVIITTLGLSCGGHHSIMTDPIGQATGRMAIAGSGQLEWRELAHNSPEGRETQHGSLSMLITSPPRD